jgi:hypothetical protein
MKISKLLTIYMFLFCSISFGYTLTVKDLETKEVKTYKIGEEEFKFSLAEKPVSCVLKQAIGFGTRSRTRLLECTDSVSGAEYTIGLNCFYDGRGEENTGWLGIRNYKIKKSFSISLSLFCNNSLVIP